MPLEDRKCNVSKAPVMCQVLDLGLRVTSRLPEDLTPQAPLAQAL